LEVNGWWLTVLGAVTPLLMAVFVVGDSPKFAGDCAVDLARRIERANLSGPVAGSGMLTGGRAGLYAAFLLGQPWYGDEPHPDPVDFERSGARLVVAVRHSALASALERDPAFASLDERLFTSPAEAARFPLTVYEVNQRQPGSSR
jgi:hypothetical protein